MQNKTKNLIKAFYVLIPVFLFFFSISSAQAANHYIREGTTCGTACDGTDWNKAYTSLEKAYPLIRGDVYYIADGTYAALKLNTTNAPLDGEKLITIKKATADNPDVTNIAGYNNTYADGQAEFLVVKDVNGVPTVDEFQIRTSYITLDGVKGSGFERTSYGFKIAGKSLLNSKSIWIGNSTQSGYRNIEIKHFDLTHEGGIPSESQTMGWNSIHIFPHNNYPPKNSNIIVSNNLFQFGVIGILVRSMDNMIIENNYFSDNHSSGVNHGSAINMFDSQKNITIRNNIFRNIKGTAVITMTEGENFYIYNNIAYETLGQTQHAGNGFVSTMTNHCSINVNIYNNTIANLQKAGVPLGVLTEPYPNGEFPYFPEGTVSTGSVFNNIWYNCEAVLLTNTTHDFNWYYNILGASNDVKNEPNSQIGTGDPFIDSSNYDFRLKTPTNPGKSDLGSPFNIDPLDNLRGADGTWDRGAYEYVSNQPTCQSGDVNCNGQINSEDIQLAINIFLGTAKQDDPDYQAKKQRADLNSDNTVNVQDIQKIINIVLNI